ncbi:F-box protein [Prunus yedoensis var. nudiflora]|uniref:F-box protein n=1 Tax=Prunus yedoensis var. nudiflora TaxID=2094558 RepID=A0A314Y8A5_PRUYE|nr:F-box protein [Prunus yedoensis var. nudiflora]
MEPVGGPELPSQVTCFQILPRLPSKSLMRFKCVRKSWSSLTRDPSFVSAHQNLGCNKNVHLLLTAWDKPTTQQHFFSLQINQEGSLVPATHLLSLPMPQTMNECLYNAQSIIGLVCLFLYNTTVPNQTDPDHPLAFLTPPPKSLSLSPALLHHAKFSPLTNEYKVLQVQELIHALRGTSSWRQIEVDCNSLRFNPFTSPFHKRSVCVNRAVHWIHGINNVILAFDIGDEKFRAIPLPKDYNCFTHRIDFPIGSIVEVDGCVALTGDKEWRLNILRLWVLRDYQNQVWVKETISFPLIGGKQGTQFLFVPFTSEGASIQYGEFKF